MANYYNKRHCETCEKETTHNFNTCCSCSCKKSYRRYHEKNKERVLQKYYDEPWGYSKTYSQKLIMSRRKGRELQFTREEFREWWDKNQKVCHYCKRDELEWNRTKKKYIRQKRLTIDRYDNDVGYTIKNIVWACPECNSEKKYMHGDEYMRLKSSD